MHHSLAAFVNQAVKNLLNVDELTYAIDWKYQADERNRVLGYQMKTV